MNRLLLLVLLTALLSLDAWPQQRTTVGGTVVSGVTGQALAGVSVSGGGQTVVTNDDGYFLLTALNPRGAQGIGGTTQGYNKGTTFFIGLQPAKSGTPKAIPQMAGEKLSVDKTSFSRSSTFSASGERR